MDISLHLVDKGCVGEGTSALTVTISWEEKPLLLVNPVFVSKPIPQRTTVTNAPLGAGKAPCSGQLVTPWQSPL